MDLKDYPLTNKLTNKAKQRLCKEEQDDELEAMKAI